MFSGMKEYESALSINFDNWYIIHHEKHACIILIPLTPLLYSKAGEMGLTVDALFFLLSSPKHRLWYTITKTRLLKYIGFFFPPKNESFLMKNSDIFHISAQNIDCGYLLELVEAVLTSTQNPCFWAKIRKIMYTPVNPSFANNNGGLIGVFLGCEYHNKWQAQ